MLFKSQITLFVSSHYLSMLFCGKTVFLPIEKPTVNLIGMKSEFQENPNKIAVTCACIFFLNIFIYQRWKENWEDCFLFDLWDVKVMASLSTKWKASVVKGYKARRLLLPWIVSCCIVERLKIHVFWRRHLKIWNASLEN